MHLVVIGLSYCTHKHILYCTRFLPWVCHEYTLVHILITFFFFSSGSAFASSKSSTTSSCPSCAARWRAVHPFCDKCVYMYMHCISNSTNTSSPHPYTRHVDMKHESHLTLAYIPCQWCWQWPLPGGASSLHWSGLWKMQSLVQWFHPYPVRRCGGRDVLLLHMHGDKPYTENTN